MLRRLLIRNFVTVAALELEFASGFTVFSGETGAGKSILIDALALTLGARADAAAVRKASARADIVAEFTPSEEVRCWLAERALDAEHDVVMLRRVIEASGRSRAFINSVPATLGALDEIGRMMVDIHGQHAHQRLMSSHAQRSLLDIYAGLAQQADAVSDAWRAWREADNAVQNASRANRDLQSEREQLVWQLSDLDQLAPQAGEWETISAEQRRLSHAASLIAGVRSALDTLSEADGALLATLSALMAQLRALAQIDDRLNETLAALEPAEIQLREAARSLNHLAPRLELEPERLAQVETRLNALYASARKFRVQPEALPVEYETRRARLAALDAAADLEVLQAAQAAAKQRYHALAKRLSAERANAAHALSGAITAGMQTLAMAGGRFEVALAPSAQGGAHGLEQVEFRVAGHADAPLRPLARVASGGELSRISLALAVATSAANLTPTLIFDEVDSGIGGAAAEVVGRLLRQLAQQRQVLCVTHLPQVAAYGGSHLCVVKATDAEGHTISVVTPLDTVGRVEEIARMLGGVKITATTRQHAKEMLAAQSV